jgi:uncharacterized protein involved in exopolysaccharide biosynthesis/Mrp family chromosome partitioning ATPase
MANELTTYSNRPAIGARSHAFSISDMLYLLYRHWRILLGGLLLGLAGAAAIFYTAPLTFRSEAKLLVRYIADSSAMDPSTEGSRVVMLDSRGENIINTEIEILVSRDSVEKVVDRIGPDQFPMHRTNGTSRARILRSIMQNLHVEVPRRSNVIRVYYDGPTPELAVQVLTYVVEAYQERHLRVRRSPEGYEFLVQQTDLNRGRLAETEEELRKLKNEFGVISLAESRQIILTRMEDIRRALGTAEADLAAAQARFKIVEPTLKYRVGPTLALSSTGRVAQAGSARERLTRLEQREQDLLVTYRADSTPVQSLRSQIEELRKVLSAIPADDESSPGDEPRYFVPEEAEVAVQQARIGALRTQLAEAGEEARRLERIESRIVQLERSRQVQEENYRTFSRSLEQARINEALEASKFSNISVIQPASLVSAMHRPKLYRNMLISLGIGLMLSLSVIAGLELLPGRKVRRTRDLETGLGVPVLLTVPKVSKPVWRDKKAASGENPRVQDETQLPTVAALQPYYDALGDRILRMMGSKSPDPCLIGVTGVGEGSGVTTMAAGLAVTLAQYHEARVLLMDPEPHVAKDGRFPGITSSSGALDILANAKGHVTVIEHNLFMLGPTLETPLPATSLVRKWPDLVSQARNGGYRFVVLDLPTLTAVSPSLRLVNQIHATVLVVEADRDQWTSVHQACDLLQRSGARVAGAVLNKVSEKQQEPGWLQAIAH